jgi:hypothetical protein
VRLFRNGADWTQRSPKIAEAALKIRATHFAIDGERVMRGVDGISDFSDALEDLRKCSLTLLMRTPSAATTCALGRETSARKISPSSSRGRPGHLHRVVLSPQDRKIVHHLFRAACNGNPEWSDPRVAPHAFWSPTIGITTPPNVLSAREGRHLFSEKMCAINDLFISALLKLRTQ